MHVEAGARIGIEQGDFEAGGGAGVCHPAAATTGGRADGHALARRQPRPASDAGAGQVDHLVDVVALDQAVTAEHGAIGSV